MSRRALELVVTRNGRHEATFEVSDDPDDARAMRDQLTGWLRSNKWDPGRWGEFEMTAFAAGTSKRLAKGIRA